MKRFLFVTLLLSVLLCGCNAEPEPLEPANFTGTVEGYEYYHENERDKKWEEDIITLAERFLTFHPWLVNEETRIRYADSYITGIVETDWVNSFNPQKHDRFLADINLLIPRIPDLSDTQLPYEIQRVIATLEDSHSALIFPKGMAFPLSFFPFQENGQTVVRLVCVPASDDDVLYAQLTAVNGIPIEEVLDKIYPYASHESEGYFLEQTLNSQYGAWITRQNMLKQVGIMEEDANTAAFSFITEDGTAVTKTFAALPSEDRNALDMANHSINNQYTFAYSDWGESYYWMEYLEEQDALYIRINTFVNDPEYPFFHLNSKFAELLTEQETIGKVIVDFRSNPGGYYLEGTPRFFELLKNEKIGKVYGLINESAMSMSVQYMYNLRYNTEDTLLAGTPAGQGIPFCSYYEDTFPTLPNSGLEYRVSTIQTVSQNGLSTVPIQPDILVYPTLEDYKNGVDTVLEYVLALE